MRSLSKDLKHSASKRRRSRGLLQGVDQGSPGSGGPARGPCPGLTVGPCFWGRELENLGWVGQVKGALPQAPLFLPLASLGNWVGFGASGSFPKRTFSESNPEGQTLSAALAACPGVHLAAHTWLLTCSFLPSETGALVLVWESDLLLSGSCSCRPASVHLGPFPRPCTSAPSSVLLSLPLRFRGPTTCNGLPLCLQAPNLRHLSLPLCIPCPP